jgi:hypothetical protein
VKTSKTHAPAHSWRILDDSIQFSRWPLFFAREALREVVEAVDSQKTRKGGEGGALFA